MGRNSTTRRLEEAARFGRRRRHGTRARTLTTRTGPARFALPRARLHQADGTTTEWQSRIVPGYQWIRLVDDALLGVYLAGGNSRRLRTALKLLRTGGPWSKDAVSRVVGQLQEAFATWRARNRTPDQVCYLCFDGWYPLVRIGKRRARVPVLVTLGVTATGGGSTCG